MTHSHNNKSWVAAFMGIALFAATYAATLPTWLGGVALAVSFMLAAPLAGQLAERLLGLPNLIGWLILGAIFEIPDALLDSSRAHTWLHGGTFHHISEAAICLLLFHEAGFPVAWKKMFSDPKLAITIAILGAVGPGLLGWTLARVVGLDDNSALTFGGMCSPTSMAITVVVMGPERTRRAPVAALFLAVAFLDDCVGLIVSGLLPTLGGGGSLSGAAIATVLSLGKFVATALLVFAAVRYLAPWAIAKLAAKNPGRPINVAAWFVTVTCAFGAASSALLGQGPILGAFMAGLALEEDKDLRPLIRSAWSEALLEAKPQDVVPIRISHVIAPVFFAGTGAEINWSQLFASWSTVGMVGILTLGLLVSLVVVKTPLAYAAGRLRPALAPVWIILLWEMIPRGEIMCVILADSLRRWPTLHAALPGVNIIGMATSAALAAFVLKRLIRKTPEHVLYGEPTPQP